MGAGSTSDAVVGGGIGIVGPAQNGNLKGIMFVRADSQNLQGGARDGGYRKARAREGNEGKMGSPAHDSVAECQLSNNSNDQ